MMRTSLTASKILIAATLFIFIAGCRNSAEVPFPPDETVFPKPVSKPFHFGAETKIKWTDSIDHVKLSIKKFDFNKLPVKIFDSAGFLPFAKKPEEAAFDLSKLPDTAFDYNNLPSKTFRFETSILEPPKLIKAGHPYIKSGTADLIYEFGEPQGLIGNHITSLFEDRKGFMWIATDQGLYRYDGENLLSYLPMGLESSIFNMIEDGRGQLWLSTLNGNGLIVIDTKHSIIKRLTKARGLTDGGVLQMLLDNEGRVWVTTFNGGINIIDEAHHIIKFLDKRRGMLHNGMIGILKDNDNNIWATTLAAGINIIDLKNGKIRHLNKANGLSTDTLTAIIRDNMNRICVAAFDGEINIINARQGKILHYNEQQGLKKILVVSLLNDAKGNIWLCTGFGTNKGVGVEIVNPAKGMIKTLNTESGIAGNHVENIVQDKHGQIWLATTTGLSLLNRGGDNIEHAGQKEITTLAEDAYEQIWIGMTNSDLGVEIFDTSTGMVRSFTKAQGLCNDTLQNIIAENGNVWIGTNGGIDFIDSTRKTIVHIGKAEGLKANKESTIMKDKHGNIWFGKNFSDAGINVFDPSKKTLRYSGLSHGIKKDTSVPDIKQDRKGQVWVATYTGGAYVIDPEKNSIRYLDDAPGLKEHYNKLFLQDDKAICGLALVKAFIL